MSAVLEDFEDKCKIGQDENEIESDKDNNPVSPSTESVTEQTGLKRKG